MACIEDFSNEIFFELFEYFDGLELYATFSNLNIRFKELLQCPYVRLKIRVPFQPSSGFRNLYNNLILPNTHRILSFSTLGTKNPDAVFSSLIIDSSFSRLESLVLWRLQSENILPVLHNLSTLSRLFSLRIYLNSHLSNNCDPYPPIFNLPLLTYTQISVPLSEPRNSVWTNNNYGSSPLQYLIMDHPCTLPRLVTLLSHTPQLRHLHCRILTGIKELIDQDMNFIVPNLTHLSIDRCEVHFGQFEILISKIGSQLEVLRFTTSRDTVYLNANRWEQLLLQHMPHLRIFEFRCDRITNARAFIMGDLHVNRFISAFWIERRWVSEFIVEIDDCGDELFTFCIHPYRKRWYQFNDLNQNSSNSLHFSSSVVLNRAGFTIDWNGVSMKKIGRISSIMQVTHLIIDCPNIPMKSLVKLSHFLPHLYSLKLYSVSIPKPTHLPNEGEEDFSMFSKIDHLMKVNLRRINELRDIECLLTLCPNMDYFQVDCSNDIDMKLLISSILTKTRSRQLHSCCICLHGQKASEDMMNGLEDVILREQLFQSFTIRCTDKTIYIQHE